MSLYPSLEDMKVDQLGHAQATLVRQQQQQHMPTYPAVMPEQPYGQQPYAPRQPYAPQQPCTGVQAQAALAGPSSSSSSLYPSLTDFMGLSLSNEVVKQNMPETGRDIVQYIPGGSAVSSYAAAPVTGEQNLGMMRAEVKQGVRLVVGCKGADGKVGLRVQHINKGVFVSFVQRGSPAAIAGLRFGDQILQINGETLAGYDRDKVMKILKKANPKMIEFAVRDRPFERSITLQKDSSGHVGFIFKEGKIKSIVKDSSAARNGLLIEHNILEINGQNCVGMKDKEISELLTQSDRSITLTIMPTFIYDHMVKCMSGSLVKKSMDHSIPDL